MRLKNDLTAAGLLSPLTRYSYTVYELNVIARQGSTKEQRDAIPPDIQAETAEEETQALYDIVASSAAELGAHIGHVSAEGEEAAHTSAQAVASAYPSPKGQTPAKGNPR